MSKELSEETKYEFNVLARQLNKDLSNLMEYLRQQDKDNKAILYVGRHLKKVILPYDEYQKMCQRLEAIENAKPSEALLCLNKIGNSNYFFGSPATVDKAAFNTIEQALLKSQEQEKVLEIIKKKNVVVEWFTKKRESEKYFKLEIYNAFIPVERQLTEEEFVLLKRYCDEQDN